MSSAGSTSDRSRTRAKGGICFEVDGDDSRRRVTLRQSIDPSFSDSIDVDEPDAREFADAPPELPLPGSGSRFSDCGDEIPPLFCEDCGEPTHVGRTCRRSRCPRCWKAWAYHRTKEVAGKIEGLRRKRNAATSKHVKNHHITLSFANLPLRFDSQNAVGRLFEVTKVLLGEIDLNAGCLVYHPWRIDPEYRGGVQDHESGNGDMTWKDILEKVQSEAWSWEAACEEFLVFKPHLHAIGPAVFVQGGEVAREIEKRTGVVIKRITKDEDPSVSLYDTEDIAGATAYAISHTGLKQRDTDDAWQSMVRMFGEAANLSPTLGVRADVEDALRTVSPTVLGLRLPDKGCSAEQVGEMEQTNASASRGSSPTSGPDDTPPAVRARGSSADAESTSTAAGEPASKSDDWDVSPGTVPDWVNEPPEEARSRCGGRLVPMWAADEYLDDLDWRASKNEGTLADLRRAYREWKNIGAPTVADLDPPD